jgi:hypothetical protein
MKSSSFSGELEAMGGLRLPAKQNDKPLQLINFFLVIQIIVQIGVLPRGIPIVRVATALSEKQHNFRGAWHRAWLLFRR